VVIVATVEDWTPDPKTGKPRYRVRWRDDRGKTQGKVCATKAAASAHGVKMEAAKLDGSYLDASKGKVTFKSFADDWLAAQTFDEATRELVASRFEHHAYPAFGAKSLASIRPSTIQAWLKGLDLAPSTVGGMLVNVSQVFSAAVDDAVLARNPCKAASVKAPKPSDDKVQPFGEDQVLAIVEAHGDRWQALPVVAAACGLRQGELFGLHRSDVDFLGRWVHVRRQLKRLKSGPAMFALPKGGKVRKVPLPQWAGLQLAELLRRYDIAESDPPALGPITGPVPGMLWTSAAGLVVRPSTWDRSTWKPALKAAGLDTGDKRNGVHRLRHTFASVLLARGESIAAVSKWLGHANPTITLRTYAHLMPSSEDQTRRIIDDVYTNRVTSVSRQAL
jgi:integrase